MRRVVNPGEIDVLLSILSSWVGDLNEVDVPKQFSKEQTPKE